MYDTDSTDEEILEYAESQCEYELRSVYEEIELCGGFLSLALLQNCSIEERCAEPSYYDRYGVKM